MAAVSQQLLLASGGGHRYWRALKTGSPGAGNFHSEVVLKDGGGTSLTITAGMLSQTGLENFTAANMVDGNLTNQGFSTDTVAADSFLKIDFGAGAAKDVHTWIFYVNNAVVAIWNIQYSDDNSSWSTVFTGLDCSGGAGAKTATW